MESCPIELFLVHQRGARWYQPGAGLAAITVSLDDTEAGATFRLTESADRVDRYIFSPELFASGSDHVLHFRVAQEATTTYRLFRALLVLQRDAKSVDAHSPWRREAIGK